MCKCGLDDEAIHTMSQIGSNYSETGVNQAIRTLDPEKCILNNKLYKDQPEVAMKPGQLSTQLKYGLIVYLRVLGVQ